jgi:hypothetical protein
MIKGVDEEDEELLEVKKGVIMRLWLLNIKYMSMVYPLMYWTKVMLITQ